MTGLASSLVASVLGPQPLVAIPLPFFHLLRDGTAAAFLAQCCFQSGRSGDPDGWFEHGHDAWRAALNLSPEQVRRCVRDCAGMVEVRRMGLPARNYYRVLPEGIEARLVTLRVPPTETPPASEVLAEPATSDPSRPQPVTASGRQQVAQQTPQHSSCKDLKKEKMIRGDDVQRTPPVSTQLLSQLLQTWNAHRGDLPEASGLSTQRRKALTVLLADCEGQIEQAIGLLTDAAKEVAGEKFWVEKKFGLDTLLPKVLGKAEVYRSRQTKGIPKVTAPLPDYGVGQLVIYRRERYAIEAITDRYIDLWDDRNGSARILLNSDDIRALKPLEVRA